MILHLVVKKEWFDKLASGEKTHEYRLAKPYWTSRLVDRQSGLFKVFTAVEIKNGYQKNAPVIMFEFERTEFLSTGILTDLKTLKPVYDIKLGKEIARGIV